MVWLAVSLAAMSAASLPGTSMCPGTHWMTTLPLTCDSLAPTSYVSSDAFAMSFCSDWLSEQARTLPSGSLEMIHSTSLDIAFISSSNLRMSRDNHYLGDNAETFAKVVWGCEEFLCAVCTLLLQVSAHHGPPTCPHAVIFGLPQRRLWSSRRLVVQHLATERFLWLPHAFGTLCRPRCEQCSHWRRSGATWKQNCSNPLSPNCLHLTVLLHYQQACFQFNFVQCLATAIAVSRHYNHAPV